MDWRREDETSEKQSLEDVKRLEHWFYSKNLHLKKSECCLKDLKNKLTKPISSFSEEMCNNNYNSLILNMASSSPKRKIKKQADLLMTKTSGAKKISLQLSSQLLQKKTDTRSTSFLCVQEPKKSSRTIIHNSAIDQETLLELHCLKLKKELNEQKREQKELLIENSHILKRISELKVVFMNALKTL